MKKFKEALTTLSICLTIAAVFTGGAAIAYATSSHHRHPRAHAATTVSAVLADAYHHAQRVCGGWKTCVWIAWNGTWPQAYLVNPYAQAGQTEWTTHEQVCVYTNPRARQLKVIWAHWGPNASSGYATSLGWGSYFEGGSC